MSNLDAPALMQQRADAAGLVIHPFPLQAKQYFLPWQVLQLTGRIPPVKPRPWQVGHFLLPLHTRQAATKIRLLFHFTQLPRRAQPDLQTKFDQGTSPCEVALARIIKMFLANESARSRLPQSEPNVQGNGPNDRLC